MGFDYSKLTDQQLEDITKGDYSKLPDNILEELAKTEKPAEAKPSKVDVINPLLGASIVTGAVAPKLSGGIATLSGGKMLYDYLEAKNKAAPVAEPTPSVAPFKHGFHPGAATNAQFNEEQRLANMLQQNLHEKPIAGFTAPANSRLILPTNVAQQIVGEATPPAPAVTPTMRQNAAALAQKAGQVVAPRGVLGKVVNTAMPYPATFGAGFNAADAINAANQGDIGRAAISGTGALGSLATMIPHKKTRGLGALLGVGAPLLNRALKPAEELDYDVQQKAQGGSVGMVQPFQDPIADYSASLTANAPSAPVNQKPVAKDHLQGYLDWVIPYEGKLHNVKGDPGGLTNYGVTAAGMTDYLGRPATAEDIAAVTPESAREIYAKTYNKLGLQDYEPKTAILAMDAAVNQGPSWTRKALQQTGGDYGKLLEARMARYAKGNPKFKKGWNNRMTQLGSYLNTLPETGD